MWKEGLSIDQDIKVRARETAWGKKSGYGILPMNTKVIFSKMV